MIDSHEGLPEASGRSFARLMECLYHTSSSRAMPEPPTTAKTHRKTARHLWIWPSRTSVADGETEDRFSKHAGSHASLLSKVRNKYTAEAAHWSPY